MRRITLRGLMARKLRLALTGLAIVLGVTFVTGTLVLGDTLNRTFDNLVGTAYQHVSFQIRGKDAFNNNPATVNGTADRKPVTQSLVASVSRVPGVSDAFGSVSGYAQFMTRNGNAIGNGGGSTLGFAFDPNPQLSPYRLVAGHAPTTADDVVMDKATATKYHFALGDRVLVDLPNRPETFTITGLVTFGSDDNLAGITLAGFDPSTAQALFNSRGHYDTISVLAAPGADTVKLQRAIAAILPAGVEVVSGQTVASELSTAINNELSFISTALLIFAFIALLVGAFTIFNTFSITVGQRTRELALLRVVGASRRQLFRSVLAEAAVTGLTASLIGLGLGVAAALGLRALLKAFGIVLPSAPLVFEARTPVVAIAVGVGVTLLSAIVPARRAVRIAPVAALVEQREEQGYGGAPADGGARNDLRGRRHRPRPGWDEPGVDRRWSASARWPSSLPPVCSRHCWPARSRACSDVRWSGCSASRVGWGARTPPATRGGPHRPPPHLWSACRWSRRSRYWARRSAPRPRPASTVPSAPSYIITGKGGFSKSVVPAVSRLPGVSTHDGRLPGPV